MKIPDGQRELGKTHTWHKESWVARRASQKEGPGAKRLVITPLGIANWKSKV